MSAQKNGLLICYFVYLITGPGVPTQSIISMPYFIFQTDDTMTQKQTESRVDAQTTSPVRAG
jgi:hypothetical protein